MDTLILDPYHRVLKDMLPEGHTIQDFISWRERPAFEEFEKGEISELEYFRRFYKDTLPEDLRQKFPRPEKIKKELLKSVEFLPGLEKIVSDLRSREDVVLGLASNYSFWYHEIFKKKSIIEESFDYLFFSCEMGRRKPEPGYYDMIHESLGKELGGADERSVLFIDDREINLEPARKIGWQTHRMEKSEALAAAIQEFLR